MTDTITLQSHAGARARCGYGPKTFPVLGGDAVLIADIGGTRFVEIREKGGYKGTVQPVLLRGLPIMEALGDAERDGDTILFDGYPPFDNGGCSAPDLLFDESHVYVRASWQRPSSVPTVTRGRDGQWRITFRDLSPGWAQVPGYRSTADPLYRTDAVRGANIDLSHALIRCFLTVFEASDRGLDLNVVIHDVERARHWFDPALAMDAAIASYVSNLDGRIKAAQKFIERARSLQAPTSPTWVNPASWDSTPVATHGDIDRILVLKAMREAMDREPGL